MVNVIWLQAGACSGNTMSLLDAEEPTFVDLVTDFGMNVLYHPSAIPLDGQAVIDLLNSVIDGKTQMDVLVVEGTVIQAPNGTGRYNMFADRPMLEWIRDLAPKAGVVVAAGDCSCWGGIPAMAPNPSDSTGLQFLKRAKGGFLGADFKSTMGLPVVNIPGCPAHPDWISQVIVALVSGRASDIALDELQRPATFFTSFTQTGCTRVQFFEYKQDPVSFGEGTRKGCLFYEMGCRGPMTHSPCNRILWNRQSSKTRAGMPCTGCTEPEYPFFDLAPGTVFKTQKVAGVIPKDFPEGIDAGSYLALAGVARAVAPAWSGEDMFVV
jgi:uptake hydrogenase small subunit